MTLMVILISIVDAQAEKFYEDNMEFLIKGDVEGLIASIEKEKDFNWAKKKITLSNKNSELYATALIAKGDVNKAAVFLDKAIKKHPKNQNLKDARKQIDFFYRDYSNKSLNFTEEEKAHIAISQLLPEYSAIREKFLQGIKSKEKMGEIESQLLSMKAKLLKYINQTSNRHPYFPTKLEYLLEFDDPQLDELVEKEAQIIIKNYRKKLFPKTLDSYELAMAYRALAILSLKDGENNKENLEKYKSFSDLKNLYLSRMSSLWLEEDIIVDRPIMKTRMRNTRFGYVLPQWISGSPF